MKAIITLSFLLALALFVWRTPNSSAARLGIPTVPLTANIPYQTYAYPAAGSGTYNYPTPGGQSISGNYNPVINYQSPFNGFNQTYSNPYYLSGVPNWPVYGYGPSTSAINGFGNFYQPENYGYNPYSAVVPNPIQQNHYYSPAPAYQPYYPSYDYFNGGYAGQNYLPFGWPVYGAPYIFTIIN